MFVSASFTVAKTWKQARYSSTGGRINKPIIHTMGHYAVLERNVLSSNLKTEEWEIHFFKVKETNVKKLYIYIYIYIYIIPTVWYFILEEAKLKAVEISTVVKGRAGEG